MKGRLMSSALDNFRSAPVQQLELGNVRLHYRVFGHGHSPAVLLLHGWPLSGVTYRHLIETLRHSYRVYVPDLPGAGDTPWSPQIQETVPGYVELLRAFVDTLQLESFAIVAHDSGGGVGRLLAAQLGSRVNCVVLQNTELPDYISPLIRFLKLMAASKLAAPVMQQLLRLRALRRSPLAFGSTFGERDLIDGEFYDACIVPLLRDMSGHMAALSHLDFSFIRSLPEAHGRIEAPIHLFWGGSDHEYFPLKKARQMQSQFRVRGELKVIPDAKLFVHEEAHEALSHFCLEVLAWGNARRSEAIDGAGPR
jgi:haloalkane dehalogenase